MAKKQTHRRSYLGHMLLLSLGVVLSVLMVSVFVVSFIFNRAVVDTVREDNEKLLRLTQKIEDNIFRMYSVMPCNCLRIFIYSVGLRKRKSQVTVI